MTQFLDEVSSIGTRVGMLDEKVAPKPVGPGTGESADRRGAFVRRLSEPPEASGAVEARRGRP